MFILILITFVGASEPPTIARSDLCPNGWVEMVSFDMGRLIFNIISSISFISMLLYHYHTSFIQRLHSDQ